MDREYTTNELEQKIPDVYELILTISKRARELNDGSQKLTSFEHYNNLTIATHEVMDGLLKPAKKPSEEDLMYTIGTKLDEEKEFSYEEWEMTATERLIEEIKEQREKVKKEKEALEKEAEEAEVEE